ncbi:MAG: GDCCVxC domain-containing (seleno)protein [Candidatus Bipolaricaulia bacterium]
MTNTLATLTWPQCSRPSRVAMAEDHSRIRYTCPHRETTLSPHKADDCGVGSSYGTRPCPSEQERAG